MPHPALLAPVLLVSSLLLVPPAPAQVPNGGAPSAPPALCTLRATAGPLATWDSRRWPDGVIPYEFASQVSGAQMVPMRQAMKAWEAVCAVEFVPRTQQNHSRWAYKDWVYIQVAPKGENWADVGRKGGRQNVMISSWTFPMCLHELGHTLGFWHEQQRPDRDTYVTIHWDNLKTGTTCNGFRANFQLIPEADAALGAYDFDSIMHYPAFPDHPCVIDKKKPTITVKPPNTGKQNTIGRAQKLSAGDVLGAQTIYGTVRMRRVSVGSSGLQGNGGSGGGWLSADGQVVVFTSLATNLVAGDTNSLPDVFVHDRGTGRTERVSVGPKGAEANGGSGALGISGDGRYVLFSSGASNLVPGDTNGATDVFVHDRQTGATTRVSVSSAGKQAKAGAFSGAISADGQVVAFVSASDDLVKGDTNKTNDVFVRDWLAPQPTTTRVSVSSGGAQGDGPSDRPSLSATGRYVAFESSATNLVAGDTNRTTDVFVHDRRRGSTALVSVSSTGQQANSASGSASISGDGRFVAFTSDATNLVAGDTNRRSDVFVHDRVSGATTRVSVSSTGQQAGGASYGSGDPSISGDGRFVAFTSWATNLVAGDTNRAPDVFVHDRRSATTTRVSVTSTGQQAANAVSYWPVSTRPWISGDGRFVAFTSNATNLVYSDTNNALDVFLHERDASTPIPAGIASIGVPCAGTSGLPRLHAAAWPAGWPRIGNAAFALGVDNARASSPVVLGLAGQRRRLGLGACTLQLDPTGAAFVGRTSDGNGRASFALPVPADVMLRGVPLFAQGFVVDPNGTYLGAVAFTNGLQLLFGD